MAHNYHLTQTGPEVQELLDKIKLATTDEPGLMSAEDKVALDSLVENAYVKPDTGIPASDLADGVIPDVSGKEDVSNKVTSLSAQSTDTQYPSAKLVYDQLATKQDVISDLADIRAGASDTVKYTQQSLTTAQKAQARSNIGAATEYFDVTYGTTTGAQIKAAYDAGKSLRLVYEGIIIAPLVIYGYTPYDPGSPGPPPSPEIPESLLARFAIADGHTIYTYEFSGDTISGNWSHRTASFPEPELEIVSYGYTTQTQIATAVAAGKLPVCKYGDNVYVYAGESSAGYSQFTSILYNIASRIYVKGSTWGSGNYEIYSKPQNGIPASDLASGVIPDVSNFITKTVDDLTNYYLKSETYTKGEVEGLIAAISQFHYEIYASTSAVTSPANNVLYLIGPTGSGADKYEEYVYASNTWTKIGDTSVDLSGYVTTSALNTALADYTTTANLTTLLADKADKSEMSVTDGTGANADKTTITLKSGTSATVLKSHQDISGKENTSNRRTSWQTTPDDTHYPSEKLVKDSLDGKQATIDAQHKLDYSLISDTPIPMTDAEIEAAVNAAWV